MHPASRRPPRVSAKIPRGNRRLPQRLSVPVSDEDAGYLTKVQTRTHLRMSALTRLLLHRGIEAHRRDGKLSD